MTTINLDRVNAISRMVASDVDPQLSIASVFATEGGGARAEVMVVINGCHAEPCRQIVNVSRADPSVFELEFREKLLQALNAHRGE